MSSEANNIRELINIMEGKSSNILMEALPTFQNLKTNFKAAFGNKRAQGAQQKERLANKFKDAWNEWLGQTNKEGDMDDLYDFLRTRAGFNSQDSKTIIDNSDVNGPIIKNRQEPEVTFPQKEETTKEEPTQNSKPEEPKKPELSVEQRNTVKSFVSSMEGMNKEIKPFFNRTDMPDKKKTEFINEFNNFVRKFASVGPLLDDYHKGEGFSTIYSYISILDKNGVDEKAFYIKDIADLKNKLKLSDSDIDKLVKYYQSNPEPKNEARIYEASLPRNVINQIFDRAAAYAYKNNLVGNSKYAASSGYASDQEQYNQRSNSNNQNNRGSYSNDQEQSQASLKRSIANSMATKVQTTAMSSAHLEPNDWEHLVSDATKQPYDENPGNKDGYAKIGWAFLRSLGRSV